MATTMRSSYTQLGIVLDCLFVPARSVHRGDRALGPDGPLGYATDVNITETNDAEGRPQSVRIRARGPALDLTMTFDVESVESTRMQMVQGPLANDVDFLQLRGQYTFSGRAGGREISGRAAGAAETFRGNK